jgi:hypothetical protein
VREHPALSSLHVEAVMAKITVAALEEKFVQVLKSTTITDEEQFISIFETRFSKEETALFEKLEQVIGPQEFDTWIRKLLKRAGKVEEVERAKKLDFDKHLKSLKAQMEETHRSMEALIAENNKAEQTLRKLREEMFSPESKRLDRELDRMMEQVARRGVKN